MNWDVHWVEMLMSDKLRLKQLVYIHGAAPLACRVLLHMDQIIHIYSSRDLFSEVTCLLSRPVSCRHLLSSIARPLSSACTSGLPGLGCKIFTEALH